MTIELKERVAQLEYRIAEMERLSIQNVIKTLADVDRLKSIFLEQESKLTALQSKSAALVDALKMADGYISLRCGTPDPIDPFADQILIGIQQQIDAALAAFKGEKG